MTTLMIHHDELHQYQEVMTREMKLLVVAMWASGAVSRHWERGWVMVHHRVTYQVCGRRVTMKECKGDTSLLWWHGFLGRKIIMEFQIVPRLLP